MHYKKHFDSLEALQRYVAATPRVWTANSSMADDRDDDWDLGAGYEGALRLARDGWKDGAQDFATGLEHLTPIDPTPEYQYDVAGYFPDVGRYCAGMPDCMMNPYTPDEGSKPIVTLVVAISSPWNNRAPCMANYGMAVVRYIDELEASGKRVELIAVNNVVLTNKAQTRVTNSFVVKRADDILDLANVAFAIAHPAMLRRLCFALKERTPREYGQCSVYGIPETVKPSDLPAEYQDAFILTGIKRANEAGKTIETALADIAREIAAHKGE